MKLNILEMEEQVYLNDYHAVDHICEIFGLGPWYTQPKEYQNASKAESNAGFTTGQGSGPDVLS